MEQTQFNQSSQWCAQLTAALATDCRHVDWFDVDLAESIAHLAETADRLRSLLASSPLARVRLLLQDDAFFWRHCTRLVSLQQVYSHAFEIRVVDESDQRPLETFLLLDTVVVRRFHPDAHRGELSLDGRTMALCRQNFASMWQRAQPASSGRRLSI